ncbi:MAG TPA: hypothetical protein VJQ85_12540 [Gaiellaceae bacterium]|nr:hypothetical protein [Gaiellaceae bacterium]
MRRVTVALACVAACVFAVGAGATNECRGLQVCVPVIGPWVVAEPGQVSFQLSCPAKFVVAGLDAELSRPGVDVTFRGSLGTPVNPGITTSRAAEFLARLLTYGTPATFRPHIGCVPANGSGERFPTVVRPRPAVPPLALQVPVRPGLHRFVARCPAGQRLAGATHAIGFYSTLPPSAALVRSVSVEQRVSGGLVRIAVHAPPLPGLNAIVQVDLECA